MEGSQQAASVCGGVVVDEYEVWVIWEEGGDDYWNRFFGTREQAEAFRAVHDVCGRARVHRGVLLVDRMGLGAVEGGSC